MSKTCKKYLTVIYDPTGKSECEVIPDAQCEGAVQNLVRMFHTNRSRGDRTVFTTSQELIMKYIRLEIKQGNLPYDDVEFWFGELTITPDKDGRLDMWPDGFCDHLDKILSQLIF